MAILTNSPSKVALHKQIQSKLTCSNSTNSAKFFPIFSISPVSFDSSLIDCLSLFRNNNNGGLFSFHRHGDLIKLSPLSSRLF